jgi:hypothetical protein
MIVTLSELSPTRRQAIVDYVFDRPHAYTTEDVAFTAEHFGWDEEQCRRIFLFAPKLAMVELDGTPLYLFAFSEDGCGNTASEVRLDGAKRHMTKSLLRFIATPEGRAFFSGTWGWADVADLDSDKVRYGWLEILGYQPGHLEEFHGITFRRFDYGER